MSEENCSECNVGDRSSSESHSEDDHSSHSTQQKRERESSTDNNSEEHHAKRKKKHKKKKSYKKLSKRLSSTPITRDFFKKMLEQQLVSKEDEKLFKFEDSDGEVESVLNILPNETGDLSDHTESTEITPEIDWADKLSLVTDILDLEKPPKEDPVQYISSVFQADDDRAGKSIRSLPPSASFLNVFTQYDKLVAGTQDSKPLKMGEFPKPPQLPHWYSIHKPVIASKDVYSNNNFEGIRNPMTQRDPKIFMISATARSMEKCQKESLSVLTYLDHFTSAIYKLQEEAVKQIKETLNEKSKESSEEKSDKKLENALSALSTSKSLLQSNAKCMTQLVKNMGYSSTVLTLLRRDSLIAACKKPVRKSKQKLRNSPLASKNLFSEEAIVAAQSEIEEQFKLSYANFLRNRDLEKYPKAGKQDKAPGSNKRKYPMSYSNQEHQSRGSQDYKRPKQDYNNNQFKRSFRGKGNRK